MKSKITIIKIRKPNIAYFNPFVEPRVKIMVMRKILIMGHESKAGTVCGDSWLAGMEIGTERNCEIQQKEGEPYLYQSILTLKQ
jgi:hypothetical protein